MKQSKQFARCALIFALTLVAGCSDPATHTPNVTLETIAGRYRLESVSGKQLPVLQGFCTIEGCGVAFAITGGHLEIGTEGSNSWRRETSVRTDFPPYEHTTVQRGTLTVDYYGKLTFSTVNPEGQTLYGAFADAVVTVSEFGTYGYRRID